MDIYSVQTNAILNMGKQIVEEMLEILRVQKTVMHAIWGNEGCTFWKKWILEALRWLLLQTKWKRKTMTVAFKVSDCPNRATRHINQNKWVMAPHLHPPMYIWYVATDLFVAAGSIFWCVAHSLMIQVTS